jgi:hypothetical protein
MLLKMISTRGTFSVLIDKKLSKTPVMGKYKSETDIELFSLSMEGYGN